MSTSDCTGKGSRFQPLIGIGPRLSVFAGIRRSDLSAIELEFRAVVVMACDEGVLPLDERIADAADEAELDDIYETERRLLYVACTRARDHLLLTGVAPASEYLGDLSNGAIIKGKPF